VDLFGLIDTGIDIFILKLTIFFENTVFLDYFYNYVELHRESRENILSDKIVTSIKSLSFFIQLIAKIRFFFSIF